MKLLQSLKIKLGNTFRLSLYTCLFIFSTLSFQETYLHATCSTFDHCNALELGLRLETEYWETVQQQEIARLSKKIACIFQGLNISGIYTRQQQITGLTGVRLPFFFIENPVATCCQDTLVFSYDFIAPVESGLVSGPTLSIWRKFNCTWKLVSHSYVPFAVP